MADGMDGRVSESDGFSDFPCSTCAKNNVQVEAAWRCVDCRANICDQCLNQHNKFDLTSGHEVLTKQQARDASRTLASVIRKTCRFHTNEVVALYCGDHNVLCCGSCTVSHRACKQLKPLPEAAGEIDTEKELEKVKLKVDLMTNQLKHLKQTRNESIEKLTKDRKDINAQFQDFRQRIDDHLNRLEEKANKEANEKFNQLTEHIENDIGRLDKLIRHLEDIARVIKDSQRDTYLDDFVNIKDAEAQVQESNVLTNSIEAMEGAEKIEFVIADDIEDYISKVETIGSVTDFFSMSVTLLDMPSVKTENDGNCIIYDCCLMEDGTVVLSDAANKELKVLDRSHKLINNLKFPSRTCGVCTVTRKEIAVAMLDKMLIQFVEVTDTLTTKRTITVGQPCRGVACHGSRLFVSCGGGGGAGEGPGQVRIYSLAGQLLQTYEKDRDGKDIFSFPRNMDVSTDGSLLYVANSLRGMVVLNSNGDVKWAFSHPDLIHVVGVCHMDVETVLVSGHQSGNVFQIGPEGKMYSVLLSKADGLESLYSLCYDDNNKRLITCGEGSKLAVYQAYRGECLTFPSGSAV